MSGSGLGAKGSRVHEDEKESIRKEVCRLPGTEGIEEMVVVGVESDLRDLVQDDQVEADGALALLRGDEDLHYLLDDEGKILDLDAFLDERDDDLRATFSRDLGCERENCWMGVQVEKQCGIVRRSSRLPSPPSTRLGRVLY